MVLQGKVTRKYIYMYHLGITPDSPMGNFIMIPDSGDYQDQTIAVSASENTLVAVGNSWNQAKDIKLPDIIKEQAVVSLELKEPPKEVITGGNWVAPARYNAFTGSIQIVSS